MTMLGDQMIFVYVTCSNQQEAKKLARTLVEERLVACGNIFPIESLYHWKGAINENTEFALVMKTRQALFNSMKERVLALHSYECPCIVALPIQQVSESYQQWMIESTQVK